MLLSYCLHENSSAADIRVYVGQWVSGCVADTCLGSQMQHMRWLAYLHKTSPFSANMVSENETWISTGRTR